MIDLKVLYTTSFSDAVNRNRLDGDNNLILTKPGPEAELVTELREALEE